MVIYSFLVMISGCFHCILFMFCSFFLPSFTFCLWHSCFILLNSFTLCMRNYLTISVLIKTGQTYWTLHADILEFLCTSPLFINRPTSHIGYKRVSSWGPSIITCKQLKRTMIMFGCFEKSGFVGGGGEHSVLLMFDSDPVLFTIIAHTKTVAHCLASVLQPSMDGCKSVAEIWRKFAVCGM